MRRTPTVERAVLADSISRRPFELASGLVATSHDTTQQFIGEYGFAVVAASSVAVSQDLSFASTHRLGPCSLRTSVAAVGCCGLRVVSLLGCERVGVHGRIVSSNRWPAIPGTHQPAQFPVRFGLSH